MPYNTHRDTGGRKRLHFEQLQHLATPPSFLLLAKTYVLKMIRSVLVFPWISLIFFCSGNVRKAWTL
jgi:hypothetical protein